ncbi:MAG: glutaredoxin domain-containing protein [Tissierellia bacterium]|nr:glutaredoxin domain-containing protein [Tissierellia bacterium]
MEFERIEKIELFFSPHCPDTEAAVKFLKEKGIPYDEYNITANMPNLKKYLEYRDLHPAFDPIRGTQTVGIPMLSINEGQVVLLDILGMDGEWIEKLTENRSFHG